MIALKNIMPMQSTWIVVADHGRAKIYTVRRGMARLHPWGELRHSPAAMDGDHDRAGGGEGQARNFAAEVALLVENGRAEQRFDELILVAAPTFLAHLRESLSQVVRDAIVAEIAKDLLGVRAETLQEHVLRVL
jgi:protein required for attachment to host cells